MIQSFPSQALFNSYCKWEGRILVGLQISVANDELKLIYFKDDFLDEYITGETELLAVEHMFKKARWLIQINTSPLRMTF